jgi:glycosyltransferase involved in cell wall biosynthesis
MNKQGNMMPAKKKVLIICLHRKDRSPGQRFRYEQYLSFLEQNGYQFDISILLNEKDDKAFYSKGNYYRKTIIFIKTLLIRTRDWFRMNRYNIIFIYRDALITGSTFFEKRFSRSKAKTIYDFDDAIWLLKVSDANKKLAFMKNAGKTPAIIGLADLVFVGNQYLADYASTFNKNIAIIPTTIDTSVYVPQPATGAKKSICIGWSGSITTIRHFAIAIPVLKKIREKFGDRVSFKIIGDKDYYCTELDTKGDAWVAATEIEDLSKIDIGIMPLPDDDWAKGKCGLKGLQYMALEIPTLMSPVGVNKEIIQHGINGYLPKTEEEWVTHLTDLIENKALREKIGKAGRQTVIDKYSVEEWKQKYLDNFNKLTETN